MKDFSATLFTLCTIYSLLTAADASHRGHEEATHRGHEEMSIASAGNVISSAGASRLMRRSEAGQVFDVESPYQLYSNMLEEPFSSQRMQEDDQPSLPTMLMGAELAATDSEVDSPALDSKSPAEISQKVAEELEEAQSKQMGRGAEMPPKLPEDDEAHAIHVQPKTTGRRPSPLAEEPQMTGASPSTPATKFFETLPLSATGDATLPQSPKTETTQPSLTLKTIEPLGTSQYAIMSGASASSKTKTIKIFGPNGETAQPSHSPDSKEKVPCGEPCDTNDRAFKHATEPSTEPSTQTLSPVPSPVPSQTSALPSPTHPSPCLVPSSSVRRPETEKPFPQDCRWYTWSAWSFCSKSCGGGSRHRTRAVAISTANGGKPCTGPADDFGVCNEFACPLDCEWGSWSSWSDCTASCGGGTQQRQKPIKVQNNSQGKPCNPSDGLQFQACSIHACARDCQWSEWSNWGLCSVSCAGGLTSRERSVLAPAIDGGKACVGPSHDERSCNNKVCPKDCVLSEWSQWEPCSVTCGNGTSHRKRAIVHERQGVGADCQPPFLESKECECLECPINCVWSDWTEWSACAATCRSSDVMTQSTRVKLVEEKFGGQPCSGESYRKQQCVLKACPVDCEYSTWSDWSTCSTTCGGGSSERERTTVVPAKDGGQECSGATRDVLPCAPVACPVDCKLRDWTPWSECSKPCGQGNSSRFRSELVPSSRGGKACSGKQNEFKACEGSDCVATSILTKKFGATQVTGIMQILTENPVIFASDPIKELLLHQVLQYDIANATISRIHASLAPGAMPRLVNVWWSFLVPNQTLLSSVLEKLQKVEKDPVLASKSFRQALQRAGSPVMENVTKFMVTQPLDEHIVADGGCPYLPHQRGTDKDVSEAQDSYWQPAELGFCVRANGSDENESVYQIDGRDYANPEDRWCCLAACARIANVGKTGGKNATGCEIIIAQPNKGCYVHFADTIDHANGYKNHWCAFSNAFVNAKKAKHQIETETEKKKKKATRIVGVVKADVPLPSTFPEEKFSANAFAVTLAEIASLDKDRLHVSLMPDVDSAVASAPRGGLKAWYSLMGPPAETEEEADAAATAICKALSSLTMLQLSEKLNENLRVGGMPNLASVNTTDVECKPQFLSRSSAGWKEQTPGKPQQKVTGNMELFVKAAREFASDARAEEGVRTAIADFGDISYESVRVSLMPPQGAQGAWDDPLSLAEQADDVETKALQTASSATKYDPDPNDPTRYEHGIGHFAIEGGLLPPTTPPPIPIRDDVAFAWFVVTLPAEPEDEGKKLEVKLNTLDAEITELKMQNHLMDAGLDTIVHVGKVKAEWHSQTEDVPLRSDDGNSSNPSLAAVSEKGELKLISKVDHLESESQAPVSESPLMVPYVEQQPAAGIGDDDDSSPPSTDSKDVALLEQGSVKAYATSLPWPVVTVTASIGVLSLS